MARGVHELRTQLIARHGEGFEFGDVAQIHRFLDKFYMSRIGIRMLIGQYLALREPPEPGHTGLIAHATSPAEVIRAAIADARYMCERQHGDAPDVQARGGPARENAQSCASPSSPLTHPRTRRDAYIA